VRKQTGLVALSVPAVLVALGVYLAWPEPVRPGVNPESFAKIKPGMTLPEVEAILGGPPAEQDDFEAVRLRHRWPVSTQSALLPAHAAWRDGAWLVVVWFDPATEKVQTTPGYIYCEGRPFRNPVRGARWLGEPPCQPPRIPEGGRFTLSARGFVVSEGFTLKALLAAKMAVSRRMLICMTYDNCDNMLQS
jgi:hypothetical protein